MYKSKLQELCHQEAWDLPIYSTAKDGHDHCPRFTTTVTVNGVLFQSPQDQCKSSKESQNVAAKLAYDHLSSASSSPSSSSSSSSSSSFNSNVALASPSSPGFVASSSNVNFRPAMNDNLRQNLGGNVKNSPANEITVVHRDETKDLLHVYKNRLQHYTQKKNLGLPEYSYEFDGPPHARLFRGSVVVDARTYRSQECYPTLKDAEHAAAKVALESLSLGDIQEDEGLYKTLLQELAQKGGFYFPTYSTIKTGPSHMPTFVSTVEVGGETYLGRECKTKKLSEMSAAKVAYNGLMERRSVNCFSPGSSTNENMEVPSFSLQPIINDKCQRKMGAETTAESHVEIPIDGTGNETNATRDRCPSRTANLHEFLPATSLSSPASPNTPSSRSMSFVSVESDAAKPASPNTPSSRSLSFVSVESDAAKPAGGNSPSAKILVFPRGSTTAIPEGASILPISDDKWVAVRVELNQNQQLE